jgi:hypothetical protein
MTQFRGRGFGLSWSNKNGSRYRTRILKSFSERWKRYPNSKAIRGLAKTQVDIDSGKRYHHYIYPQVTMTG